MFKYFFRHFNHNYKNFVLTLIVILISNIMLATFSLLLINAIVQAAQINLETNESMVGTLTIFSSLCGIVFFMSLFSLFSCVNLSVQLRNDQFKLLRTLGFTNQKIKLQIFWENLLMSVFGVCVAILLAIPLAGEMVKVLHHFNVIEPSFTLEINFKYQWIYSLTTCVFTILIGFFSSLDLKNLIVENEFKKKKTNKNKKNIVRIIFGCLFYLAALSLVLNKFTMQGEVGQNLIIIVIMLMLVGFVLVGEWIIKAWLTLLLMCSFNHLFQNVLKSMIDKRKKLKSIISLLISLYFFINFATSTSLLGQSTTTNQVNSAILAIIIGIFNVVICTNLIILYFSETKKELTVLKVLGFSKKQLKIHILSEYLTILSSAFVFGVPVMMIINVILCAYNGWNITFSNNFSLFWGLNLGVFGGFLLIGNVFFWNLNEI